MTRTVLEIIQAVVRARLNLHAVDIPGAFVVSHAAEDVLQALDEACYVIVPRVPTEAMQRASRIVTDLPAGLPLERQPARITTWGANVWAAMLDAAPSPTTETTTDET